MQEEFREERGRSRKQSEGLTKRRYTLKGEKLHRLSFASRTCTNEGVEYAVGREGFGGSRTRIFILAPPCQGRRDFCPYVVLMGSVMTSVHDRNFLPARFYCNESSGSKRLHLGARDSSLFPPFFSCLQDTYHPKMCGFP